MKKRYANLLLMVVTIIWGGGFLATDGALETISPFYVMMIRFLGASIFPLVLGWKKLKKLSALQIKQGVITGFFLFFAFAFQTFGLVYSTPGKNAFLTATNVVFVPYLLWFIYHKKPTRKEIFASMICVIGIALLTLKPNALFLGLGDILSIICAVFFALHIISLERYGAHTDAICMTALQMITAGIISSVCAFLFETAPSTIPLRAMGNIAYLIFVSTLLAYLLQTYAQKFTSANSASLIISMEALFASLFSYLLLHEVMTPLMMLGAILIFLSVIFLEYRPKKNKNIKN